MQDSGSLAVFKVTARDQGHYKGPSGAFVTYCNISCFIFFSQKLRLDVSDESSARQRIHMKNQALISSKDIGKKLKCRLLQFLFGALGLTSQYT